MVENGSFGLKDTSSLLKSKQDIVKGISEQEVIVDIGFDYKPVVKERLRKHGLSFKDEELDFFEIAKQHEGSQAQYLLEQMIDQHWVFLSHLQKERKTSEHLHNVPVEEFYDPLAGVVTLFIDGKEHELSKAKGPLIVAAGQFHQLQTDGSSTLNLIIMKNSAGIPRERLHIRR